MTRALTFARPAWKLAAILSLTTVATAMAVNWAHPFSMDFMSYWAAAKLALAGTPRLAWDVAAHHAVEATAVPSPTMMPFPYPPPFLMIVAPLGLLPYGAAAALWIALSVALYALAVRRIAPELGAVALAFPPVVACGVIGQNGFLTTALMIGAVLTVKARPGVSGLLIAALAIKPQLGLLIPLALIAGREWRAFAAAAAGLLAYAAASWLLFGGEAWHGFLALMPMYGEIVTKGLVGWHKTASLFAALRLAGAPAWTAWGAHGVAALAGAVLVWRSWRTSDDPLTRGAALAIGTALASPYLYIYDQLMLIVAVAWARREGLGEAGTALLLAIPLAAFAQVIAEAPILNVAPLLPLALLVMMWRNASGKAEAGTFPSPTAAKHLLPSLQAGRGEAIFSSCRTAPWRIRRCR